MWNPCFTRSFNDWELVEVENLLGRLGGERVLLDEEAEVRWLESKDGNFSIKSLYKVLELDLYKVSVVVEASFYLMQCVFGVPFIGKGDPLGLEWCLGRQKV